MSAIWLQENNNGKAFASIISASMLDVRYWETECKIGAFRLTSETE